MGKAAKQTEAQMCTLFFELCFLFEISEAGSYEKTI